MRSVNIHDAKTNLSKLIEQAVSQGEGFVIAKSGKPLVKVIPLDQEQSPKSRVGFLKGRTNAPLHFDQLGREEIEAMFEGGD